MTRETLPKPMATLVTVVVALLSAVLALCPCEAQAATRADVPSVLVIDAGLGDYDLCVLHWLGETAEPIVDSAHAVLASSADPVWWSEGGGSGDAPATFVLGMKAGEALTSDDIVWALDQIRASGAEPRTFVVAMGLTGLPLRQYAEDLASVTQSSRADLVGMAFCGTPHGGFSAMSTYPELAIWDKVAATIGVSRTDLAPGSSTFQTLDAGSFPAVCRTLLVNGSVGDLGFGQTDGLSATKDLALSSSVTTQVQSAQTNSTIGQACNLTSVWVPFTSEIDYPDRAVDKSITERLSAIASYEVSSEVQEEVREFYEAWFDKGTPVTHISTALMLDLSGSMREKVDAGRDKLSAAKEACKEYLRSMQAVSELPQAAPMDVTIIGFAEGASTIASSYDKAACDAVDGMTARGETNIGLALDQAIDYLSRSPVCGNQHMLLLSDGASTVGQTEEQMLAGAVAKAKAAGIAIDTIGFGDIGESNAGFLKRVSDATGGTYYLAQDTYDLKVNFLKSYYSSLGLELIDEEVQAGSPATVSIGAADKHTVALEAGIVSQTGVPQVRVLCDGEELDQSLYALSEEYGLVSLQVVDPKPGEYTLEMSGDTGSMHVFAVRLPGIATSWHGTEANQDYALYLMIAAAVVLVAAIGIVVARTLVKRRK